MRDACQARDISLSESLTIRLMPTVPLSPHLLIIVLPQHKMPTCPTPHFSVPLPHSTAIPEGPKVSEMSRRDWHLPDIQGAQQGRHTQKVGWE